MHKIRTLKHLPNTLLSTSFKEELSVIILPYTEGYVQTISELRETIPFEIHTKIKENSNDFCNDEYKKVFQYIYIYYQHFSYTSIFTNYFIPIKSLESLYDAIYLDTSLRFQLPILLSDVHNSQKPKLELQSISFDTIIDNPEFLLQDSILLADYKEQNLKKILSWVLFVTEDIPDYNIHIDIKGDYEEYLIFYLYNNVFYIKNIDEDRCLWVANLFKNKYYLDDVYISNDNLS